jgi:hypothetical protein
VAKTPDHMKGIDSLPKWNPANPTTYAYDPKHYDAADYAKFKAARLAAQNKQQKATAARSKQLTLELNKIMKDTIRDELKKRPGVTREQVKEQANKGKMLMADTPSECFESVFFQDGTCTCVFARDGYVWETEMEVDEFLDLFGTGDSLGVAWNENFHGQPSD